MLFLDLLTLECIAYMLLLKPMEYLWWKMAPSTTFCLGTLCFPFNWGLVYTSVMPLIISLAWSIGAGLIISISTRILGCTSQFLRVRIQPVIQVSLILWYQPCYLVATRSNIVFQGELYA